MFDVLLLAAGLPSGSRDEVKEREGGRKPSLACQLCFFAEFIINAVGLIINPSLISSIVYELLSS